VAVVAVLAVEAERVAAVRAEAPVLAAVLAAAVDMRVGGIAVHAAQVAGVFPGIPTQTSTTILSTSLA
jgi:hypothetical protein